MKDYKQGCHIIREFRELSSSGSIKTDWSAAFVTVVQETKCEGLHHGVIRVKEEKMEGIKVHLARVLDRVGTRGRLQ